MKKKTAIFGLLFIIVIPIIFSCKNKGQKVVNEAAQSDSLDFTSGADLEYSKVEIYCWCFSSDAFESGSRCTTPAALKPSEIIRPVNLYRSINDKDTVEALRRIIFDKKEKEEQLEYGGTDIRLLFLWKGNSKTDMIVFYEDSTLFYNSKTFFRYSFKIMDSIKAVLNLKEINCEDPPLIPDDVQ